MFINIDARMHIYDFHIYFLEIFQQIHQSACFLCLFWQSDNEYWNYDVSVLYRLAEFGWLPGAGVFNTDVCSGGCSDPYHGTQV
jgi:hypothetical protein